MRKETLLKGGIGAAATMLAVTGAGAGARLQGAFTGPPGDNGADQSQTEASAPLNAPQQLSPPGGTVVPPDDLLARLYGHDRALAEMAQDIPGFGGIYIGPDGATLVVNVTEPSLTRVESVKVSIARVFPEDTHLQTRNIQLRKVQYSFLELARWYVPLSPLVLAHEGVVFTDIDERSNRIEIGVLNAGAEAWVKERLKELSIPDTAAAVELSEPYVPDSSLQDYHRPLVGGLLIRRAPDGRGCTYGMFARRVSNGVNGFVTASHCTNIRGGNENTAFYQPSIDPDGKNKIGTEVLDPPYLRGISGCPEGRDCRYSDSAWANAVSPQSVGALALSGFRTPIWNGSTRNIVATAFSSDGEQVEKVGRTTGRTIGVVARVCMESNTVNNITLTLTRFPGLVTS